MTDTTEHFASTLTQGADRFLAEAVDHTLETGRRTKAEFIALFPPMKIMEALEKVPELRARFLTLLVGVRERTALRTPHQDAGRLLEAALTEGDCDPEAIVDVFDPDDRVRYLPSRLLWLFLTEDEFWKVSRSKDPTGHKAAQRYVAYWIDRGISHGLHSHQDIVEGITIEAIADKLPRGELAKALKRALEMGRESLPYTESDLYGAVPADVLVDHIALAHLMDNVVSPMARRAMYLEPPPVPRTDDVPDFDIPSTPPQTSDGAEAQQEGSAGE